MPWLRSTISLIAPGTAFEKLGQPQPASNLVSESNSWLAAADAVVAAVGPDGLVLAGEGALGGGVAGDLEFHRRPARAPFGVGLADFPLGHRGFSIVVVHEEQLISMVRPSRAGSRPSASWPGCSSNGAAAAPASVATPEKSLSLRPFDGQLRQVVAQHVFGVGARASQAVAAQRRAFSGAAGRDIVAARRRRRPGRGTGRAPARRPVAGRDRSPRRRQKMRVVDLARGQQLEHAFDQRAVAVRLDVRQAQLGAQRASIARGKRRLVRLQRRLRRPASPISGSSAWPRQNRFQ